MCKRHFSPIAAALFLISVVLAPATALAQWPDLTRPSGIDKSGSKDVAVVVAIDDYILLPDVDGAIDNANDWEAFLRQSLGVPTVHMLTNQDATREGMLKFAKIAANDVEEGGTIWWIFIGHGAPTINGTDGLLVGMDAQQSAESLQARSMRRGELLAALEAESNNTVVVLDACFSGRSQDGEALADGVQPVIAVDAIARLGTTSVVLSAAKPTELAGRLPGARRPAFSYLVLGALRGWADDGDGEVTAEEVLYFTRRELRGVKGRQQTPQLEGDGTRTLSKGATEARPEIDVDASQPGEPVDDEVGTTEADTGASSKAERKISYLARRVTYDGVAFRQNGRVLDPIPFYHAVDRPDLAGEFSGHTPWMWGTGAAVMAAGVALMVWGFSETGVDSEQRSSGVLLGGIMGGFFAFGGGTALFVVGLIKDQHPVSHHERESLAQIHNRQLRDEMGLGPEDDPPVERRDGAFWNPFSMTVPKQNGVYLSVRF